MNEQTLLLTDNKIEASNINFRRYQLNYIKENVQSKNDVINKKLLEIQKVEYVYAECV